MKMNKTPEMDSVNALNLLDLTPKHSLITKAKKNKISMADERIAYTLVSKTGEPHKPLFIIQAECDNVIVHGAGPSKKVAKRNATYNWLKKLNVQAATSRRPDGNNTGDGNGAKRAAARPTTKPTNKLQEICQALRWPLPEYECEVNLNEQQKLNFNVACKVQSNVAKCNGTNKNVAKNGAARKMYNEILRL